MWTFVEYAVHRWLFHLKPPANSRLLITMHFLFHGQHHKVHSVQMSGAKSECKMFG